jgi:hypothetical protein
VSERRRVQAGAGWHSTGFYDWLASLDARREEQLRRGQEIRPRPASTPQSILGGVRPADVWWQGQWWSADMWQDQVAAWGGRDPRLPPVKTDYKWRPIADGVMVDFPPSVRRVCHMPDAVKDYSHERGQID